MTSDVIDTCPPAVSLSPARPAPCPLRSATLSLSRLQAPLVSLPAGMFIIVSLLSYPCVQASSLTRLHLLWAGLALRPVAHTSRATPATPAGPPEGSTRARQRAHQAREVRSRTQAILLLVWITMDMGWAAVGPTRKASSCPPGGRSVGLAWGGQAPRSSDHELTSLLWSLSLLSEEKKLMGDIKRSAKAGQMVRRSLPSVR